jgi:hypothetical protein
VVSNSKEKTTLESLGVAEVGVHEELATARKGRRRRRIIRRKASLLTIGHREGDAERSIVAGRARLVTQKGAPGVELTNS